jgi:dolichol-phosphate mannosyltransferase
MKPTLAVMVCFDTRLWTAQTLARFPAERDYDLLVVDDGSTDGTPEVLEASGLSVVRHPANRGLGAAIKSGISAALTGGYEAVVILAGNGKDDPAEIPRFLEALSAGHDYVQGSRFRAGGSHHNLPGGRHLLVRLHGLLVRLLTGFPGTDAINGFRAYRLSLFQDPRIDIWQDWLDRYEFESYLHYKVLTLGYRVTEVPVSKTYPRPGSGLRYSHIRPVVDWWSILRPYVLLKLGLRS